MAQVQFNDTCMPDETFVHVTPHYTILALVLALISILTIFGNSLVVYAVVVSPSLHAATNYLVASLAIADLIVGMLVMPFNIVYAVTERRWLFGLVFCDIWHSLDVLASTASILNLCCISIDRYMAIKDPLFYLERVTEERVYKVIALIWLMSLAVSFPAIVWWRMLSSPEIYADECKCLFTDSISYVLFSSAISFYFPLVIILGTYCSIYVIARRFQNRIGSVREKKRTSSVKENDACIDMMRINRGASRKAATTNRKSLRRGRRRPQGPTSIEDTSSVIQVTGSTENGTQIEEPLISEDMECQETSFPRGGGGKGVGISAMLMHSVPGMAAKCVKKLEARMKFEKKRFFQEKKAAKTLGIVIGCFVVCWLPFFVVNVCLVIEPNLLSGTKTALLISVVTWLGHCNSCLNPLIYTYNVQFRKAFKKILCSKRVSKQFTILQHRRHTRVDAPTRGSQQRTN